MPRLTDLSVMLLAISWVVLTLSLRPLFAELGASWPRLLDIIWYVLGVALAVVAIVRAWPPRVAG